MDEKKRSRAPGDDDAAAVNSIRVAIELAQETFPDGLSIKLNSRSNQDTSFENPGEVFDVLAWLATAYRIAFARDEANDRVIVGFIGVHQRNRQS